MSRILCTFPGRHGDLLWALPTIRAVSERAQTPVDLQIAGEFAGLVPLLQQQPYLDQIVAEPSWGLSPEQAWQPPTVPAGPYEAIYHLGYRRWPQLPLPYEVEQTLWTEYGVRVAIELERPWIRVEGPGYPTELSLGFTEAYFELKLGLLVALDRLGLADAPPRLLLTPYGSRWTTEAVGLVSVQPCSCLLAAQTIRNSDCFLGDCSALHVLAAAIGRPVLVVEPMESRWNPIFWPYGMDGPRVTCVKGLDDQPTWHAPHVADAVKKALAYA